ncbi:unnamed protein product [Moneuplotes crassus]|uniref:Cullin family profile domain-containing protein n=1 Tax=Euplotes crassus TaxID=5936 RepID=A0AAD1Y4H4_EUPCR|nr:unnamed protein product [Moneuplotes crassus]
MGQSCCKRLPKVDHRRRQTDSIVSQRIKRFKFKKNEQPLMRGNDEVIVRQNEAHTNIVQKRESRKFVLKNDCGDIQNLTFESSIEMIEGFMGKLLEFLETGEIAIQNKEYVSCYTKVLAQIEDLREEDLLKEYTLQFDNFTLVTRWLSKVFDFVDRNYVKFNRLESFVFTALGLFRDIVFTNLKQALTSALLISFQRHRLKEDVHWEFIHKTLQTFVDIGYKQDVQLKKNGNDYCWSGVKDLSKYRDVFENKFIKETQDYYSIKATEWAQNLSCPEYIAVVQETLEMEEQILVDYMDQSTKNQLKLALNKILIEWKAEEIITRQESGCQELLKNKSVYLLSQMYLLYSRVEPTLKYILLELSNYVEELGQILISNEGLQKQPIKFVEKLLELMAEIQEIVLKCFQNDRKFHLACENSFLSFMNKFSETPQYIAGYCDHLFKGGIRGMTENQIEDTFEAVICLFRCIHDRDIFIKVYTKYLAQRLLNKTSLNADAEKSMISKLKIECGINTVRRLTKMFTDIELSKSTMNDFKIYNRGTTEFRGVDINVDILTSGMWPEKTAYSCKLPPELSVCSQKFSLFYKEKNGGRNLKWLYGSCNAVINTLLFNKTYTLTVTCYQAVILCLFNEHERLTVAQVKEMSCLPEEELVRQLKQLCNPKMRLLSKDKPKVPKFAPDEGLEVNTNFKYNLVKVNFIPKVVYKKKHLQKMTDIENKIKEEIKSERALVLDAMIVRIMKARKKESHTELITEVIKQIFLFKPQPQMIKQSIERLIEKEYLKRSKDDLQIYIYIP